jgi:hypothetical protein
MEGQQPLSLFALCCVPGMRVDSEIHIGAGCVLECYRRARGLSTRRGANGRMD